VEARIPQLSAKGSATRSSSGPSTSVKPREATAASEDEPGRVAQFEPPGARVHLVDGGDADSRRNQHQVETSRPFGSCCASGWVSTTRTAGSTAEIFANTCATEAPARSRGRGSAGRRRGRVPRRPAAGRSRGALRTPTRSDGRRGCRSDPLHRVDGTGVAGRFADQAGVHPLRHRIPERERVARDEERARHDRGGTDGDGSFDPHPAVATQAPRRGRLGSRTRRAHDRLPATAMPALRGAGTWTIDASIGSRQPHSRAPLRLRGQRPSRCQASPQPTIPGRRQAEQPLPVQTGRGRLAILNSCSSPSPMRRPRTDTRRRTDGADRPEDDDDDVATIEGGA